MSRFRRCAGERFCGLRGFAGGESATVTTVKAPVRSATLRIHSTALLARRSDIVHSIGMFHYIVKLTPFV
jgi:hypothetical protein